MTETEIPTAGMSPFQATVWMRETVASGMNWANTRKRRFRQRASLAYTLSITLTAASTVILGLQDLNIWADIAFGMVAITTAINAFEPFFNWRSRWVLMEEAQYRLNRILDDVDYYIASHGEDEVQRADLQTFHDRHEEIWSDISHRWLQYRRADRKERSPTS